jgi:hypothetical protein
MFSKVVDAIRRDTGGAKAHGCPVLWSRFNAEKKEDQAGKLRFYG